MRIFLLCLSGIFSGSWQSNLNGWSPLSNYLPHISLPIWRRRRCPCQYFTVVFVMVVATVAVSNTHLYVICCHFIWLILLVGILPLWGLIKQSSQVISPVPSPKWQPQHSNHLFLVFVKIPHCWSFIGICGWQRLKQMCCIAVEYTGQWR